MPQRTRQRRSWNPVPHDGRFDAVEGLKLLFPAWADNVGRSHAQDDKKAARVERRVSWDENFGTYFRFAPKDPSLSRAAHNRLLAAFSDTYKLQTAIDEVISNFSREKPQSTLKHGSNKSIDHIEVIDVHDIPNACPILTVAGERLMIARGSMRSAISLPADRLLLGLLLRLIKRLPEQTLLSKALTHVINSSEGCGFIADMLAELASPFGGLGLRPNSSDALVDEKAVIRLEGRVARVYFGRAPDRQIAAKPGIWPGH